MAVDFSNLTKRSRTEIKRPDALPVLDYPAVILRQEFGDDNRNKTPYCRYFVRLLGWPEGETPQLDAKGAEIDVTKRQFRADFYLTPDSDYILNEFLTSLGIEEEDLGVAIQQAVGMQVTARISQRMDEKTNTIYNPPFLDSLRAPSV